MNIKIFCFLVTAAVVLPISHPLRERVSDYEAMNKIDTFDFFK